MGGLEEGGGMEGKVVVGVCYQNSQLPPSPRSHLASQPSRSQDDCGLDINHLTGRAKQTPGMVVLYRMWSRVKSCLIVVLHDCRILFVLRVFFFTSRSVCSLKGGGHGVKPLFMFGTGRMMLENYGVSRM